MPKSLHAREMEVDARVVSQRLWSYAYSFQLRFAGTHRAFVTERNVAFASALLQSNLFSPVTLAQHVPFIFFSTEPANANRR